MADARDILARLVAVIPVRTGPGGVKQFLGNTCRMMAVRQEAVDFLAASQPAQPPGAVCIDCLGDGGDAGSRFNPCPTCGKARTDG